MLVLPMIVCLASHPIRAQSDNTEKIYQRLLKSTVWVVVPKSRDITTHRLALTTGSGSLIDRARKLVLTNYHVVRSIVGKDHEKVIVAFPVFRNASASFTICWRFACLLFLQLQRPTRPLRPSCASTRLPSVRTPTPC